MVSHMLRKHWGGGGGGTQGREQALQAQTGTQGNAMLRLGLDPQGLADALLKPKASSMSRKWLGLDLILLLSQTPPNFRPPRMKRTFHRQWSAREHSSPLSRETPDRVGVDKRMNV